MTGPPAGKSAVRGAVGRLGKSLLRSSVFQAVAARLLYSFLWFTYHTNRPVASSRTLDELARREGPLIIALWHGQQSLVSFARPQGERVVGLVSRSADAEINARVLELAGCDVVRGSGGRVREAAVRKGGVKALIALRNALAEGRHVVMIADISKGEPRLAGEGIVRLAKLSGRPIVPLALATSRFRVMERAWDRMTINLPFGRRCLRFGDPIYLGKTAGEAEIDAARRELTDSLNRITEEAHACAEAGS